MISKYNEKKDTANFIVDILIYLLGQIRQTYNIYVKEKLHQLPKTIMLMYLV